MCIKLVNYRDKYNEMHGQQNVRICGSNVKISQESYNCFSNDGIHCAVKGVIRVRGRAVQAYMTPECKGQ